MSDNTETPTGYDAQVHFRAPSDFMPLVRLAARPCLSVLPLGNEEPALVPQQLKAA